jgi:hypothetical protein
MANLITRTPLKIPHDTDSDIAPVILKVIDDGPNFRQMAIAAREAFSKAIIASHDEPKDILVLQGGEFKITPINKAQQSSLLNISENIRQKNQSLSTQ